MRKRGDVEPPARIVSIRWIVSGAALAMTVAAVLAVGAVGERNTRRALGRELESRLVLSARNLAMTSSRALLSDFPELTLAPILSEMESTQAELSFAAVVDAAAVVRGHANARRIGEEFRLPASLASRASLGRLADGERLYGDDSLAVAEAPVLHPAGHRIGTAYVGFRRAYVEQVVADARRAQLIVVGLVLAAGVLLVPVLLSVLLRPVAVLRAGLERIGRGDLRTPVRLRDRSEFGLLATTVNDMARRIDAAQQESREHERLAHELELARQIQSALLPSGGLTAGRFRVEGSHRAAAEVGGDFFDMLELPDGRVGLAIADVSGKGLAGCLVTSMLAGLIRAFGPQYPSPRELLIRLDGTLRGSLRPGTFVTMFYGVLDPADGSLVFASAGHCPLLIRRAAGPLEWHRTSGIPIGAVRGDRIAGTLRDERIVLAPGDLAIQYTDGVNEAFDPSGERTLGFDGIERAVAGVAAAPEEIVARLRAAVDAWSAGGARHDDETLLVIGADPAPRPGGAAACDDPRRAFAEATGRGERLRLPADLDALERLEPWLAARRGLAELEPRWMRLVHAAVYELCANVMEHAYRLDPSRTLDLFWLRDDVRSAGVAGRFVLVDQGVAFVPEPVRVDFRDPEARRKGRGIGLEIIRTVMRPAHHTLPDVGNVTILSFDTATLEEEEVRHA